MYTESIGTTQGIMSMDFKYEKESAKNLNPNAYIKQDNRIVNGRWKMNLNQSRIFLSAISMISHEEEFQTYCIRGKELKDMLELKGNSLYEQLSRDVPKLMTTFVAIEHEKGKDKQWFSLVSSCRYKYGDLFIKFDDGLKPYLLDIKSKFTQFKLSDAMKFKSMYSLRLFIMLKQYDSTGWRHLKLEELRDVFDLNVTKENRLKKDMYPKVNDFKKRVLTPAIEELNKHGFKVKVQEIKDGRKISAYKFSWHGIALMKKSAELIEPLKPKTEAGARLQERLSKYGLSATQVDYVSYAIKNGIVKLKELNQTLYGFDQIIKAKPIAKANVSGYVYTALKKKYGFQF